jgi:zinc protease
MNRPLPMIFRLLLMVAALTGASTNAASFAPKKVASVEGITEYHLENGLRVLLFPRPTPPKVSVHRAVRVGTRHEG